MAGDLTQRACNQSFAGRSLCHEDDVLQIEFLGVGRLVSISADRTVKLWDTDQIRPLGKLASLDDLPVGIVSSATGQSMVYTIAGESKVIARETIEQLSSGAQRKQVQADGPQAMQVDEIARAESLKATELAESEPNSDFSSAIKVEVPVKITGVIAKNGAEADQDVYRFSAKAGERWILGVNAARSGSPLDSRIEVFDEYGKNVVQTRLQALRESYFTFRGKDSSTSDDFRVHNWEDMELNEYLYAGGEVVKLWLYPRGPDSGFKVYPGQGARYTYFGTTPTSHALGAPAYIVRALVDEEEALPMDCRCFRSSTRTMTMDCDDGERTRVCRLLHLAVAITLYAFATRGDSVATTISTHWKSFHLVPTLKSRLKARS